MAYPEEGEEEQTAGGAAGYEAVQEDTGRQLAGGRGYSSYSDANKYRQQLELMMDSKKIKKQDFQLNTADDRFTAIYDKTEFAIDPTHKHYKEESSG